MSPSQSYLAKLLAQRKDYNNQPSSAQKNQLSTAQNSSKVSSLQRSITSRPSFPVSHLPYL
jgi:hypothetical protein